MAALLCSVGFAEDFSFAEGMYPADAFNSRFITGGFWSCGECRTGGFGEVGIAIVDEGKSSLVLRNSITFGGYGMTVRENNGLEFGEAVIGDKLMIGGVTDCLLFKIRSYGFMGAGIGFWGSEDCGFAEGAPLFELSFGGGFELQYAESNAFVIEFGGRCEGPVGKYKARYLDCTNSSPLLTIGFRMLK